jgi:hypothetical protein
MHPLCSNNTYFLRSRTDVVFLVVPATFPIKSMYFDEVGDAVSLSDKLTTSQVKERVKLVR